MSKKDKYLQITDGTTKVFVFQDIDYRGYDPFVYRDINRLIYRTPEWKPVEPPFVFDDCLGCGYCKLEKSCTKHDKNINQAKLGCKEYERYGD